MNKYTKYDLRILITLVMLNIVFTLAALYFTYIGVSSGLFYESIPASANLFATVGLETGILFSVALAILIPIIFISIYFSFFPLVKYKIIKLAPLEDYDSLKSLFFLLSFLPLATLGLLHGIDMTHNVVAFASGGQILLLH